MIMGQGFPGQNCPVLKGEMQLKINSSSMRNGQSQWRPRATGAIEPNWFKISRITQVVGVWEKYPQETRQTCLRCSKCSSVVLCISSPVSVPKWYALSISCSPIPFSGHLDVCPKALEFLSWVRQCLPRRPSASPPPSPPHRPPSRYPAESTILAEGFLSLEMPPFCVKLSKPWTRGLSQGQSYGVSGEEGVLPFHFPFEALFLPLATGDSQTLALLRHTNHHANCYVLRSTIGWCIPSLGPLLIYLEAEEATALS